MNLRFHVSPAPRSTTTAAERTPMHTMIDVDVDFEEDTPKPRGRSHETWLRARGWTSED